jgi:hypothetical protein
VFCALAPGLRQVT